MIGLHIKANGNELKWSRDPHDMYALRVTVPAGTKRLDVKMESGLAVGGDGFSPRPPSDQLAIIPWNEFLLFPKGIDAEKVMIDASVRAARGLGIASALEASRPRRLRTSRPRRSRA